MSYTLSVPIALGSSKTGLTLTATIIDTSGATVSTTGSGFVEIGSGNYLWTGSLPDNHRGAVVFTGTGVAVIAAINPEEIEKINLLQTLTASTTQYNSLLNAESTTYAAIGANQSTLINTFLEPMSVQLGDVDTNVDTVLTMVGTLETEADALSRYEDILAAVQALGPGVGALSQTLYITDESNVPLDGVSVYVTATDNPGDTVLASGVTASTGEVTVFLDAGTYYCWVQRTNYNGLNPITFTVAP